jgi:site-specific recombinase XerD
VGETHPKWPEIPVQDLPNGRFLRLNPIFYSLAGFAEIGEKTGIPRDSLFFCCSPVNTSQRRSTNITKGRIIMNKNRTKELMMISVEKAIDQYLATLATEGKSPRYIEWLKSRLNTFRAYLLETGRESYKLQDLTVEDGREYLRYLMERQKRYTNHPLHKERDGKLTIYYIHGLGRALRSYSTWAHEEGYLDENVMRRLKLPKLPITYPQPLSPDEIEKVLSACLDDTIERLRNFSIMMMFLDTGIRLDELTGLNLSRIDFTVGEMTVFGKGGKERKVPIGLQAKKALLEYIRTYANVIWTLGDLNC